MFKLKLIAVAAIGVVAAVAPAGLAAGSGATVVTGSTQLIDTHGQNRIFTFTAVQLPNGTVTGQAQLRTFGGGTLHLSIDCLNVTGNQAVIGATITQASDPEIVGAPVLFAVQDDPDLFTFTILPDFPGAEFPSCSEVDASVLLEFFGIPVEQGSITVR